MTWEWCRVGVDATYYVVSTSIRRHFGTRCPLGMILLVNVCTNPWSAEQEFQPTTF